MERFAPSLQRVYCFLFGGWYRRRPEEGLLFINTWLKLLLFCCFHRPQTLSGQTPRPCKTSATFPDIRSASHVFGKLMSTQAVKWTSGEVGLCHAQIFPQVDFGEARRHAILPRARSQYYRCRGLESGGSPRHTCIRSFPACPPQADVCHPLCNPSTCRKPYHFGLSQRFHIRRRAQ